jgi:hypothetical protein
VIEFQHRRICWERRHEKDGIGMLEQKFLKIISLSEGYPPPDCALRNLVGRSLIVLYTRAEKRTPFDTLQALLRLVGDVKNLEKDVPEVYVAKIHFFSILMLIMQKSWPSLRFGVSET